MEAGIKEEKWGRLWGKDKDTAGVKLGEESRQGKELGQQMKATYMEGQSNFHRG